MDKKQKKKVILIGIFILIIAILGVGGYYLFFNNNDSGNILKPKTTTTTTKVLKIVNPETKTRPFAVMINNLGTARPLQSGLQDAIIMYEIIVEGGLTRYMAVFQDQTTERIGSIRSARHYFLDYALENDAIYVHHGQSPQAQEDFGNLNVDHIVVGDST